MKSNIFLTLEEIVGTDGVTILKKSIVHKLSGSVSDPLETYLPLLVMPRAIMSWLVQNIKPMKVGEYKDLTMPGKLDVTISVQKQDLDVYRAEFVQRGKIIHTFDRQGLPSFGGHLMTIGETYESFADQPDEKPAPKAEAEEKKEASVEIKPESSSKEVARTILHMNDFAMETSDPEHAKLALQHANIKELTGAIGKLVDALVRKEIVRKDVDSELDKAAMPDSKEQGKVEVSIEPEDKAKKDMKAMGSNKDIKEKGMSLQELDKLKAKPTVEQDVPECEPVKAGLDAQKAKIEKEKAMTKDAPKESCSTCEGTGKVYNNADPKSGQYVTCPHCAAGKKVIHSEDKVELEPSAKMSSAQARSRLKSHYMKASQKVNKAEKPGGAAAPKGPAGPIPPKPPVGPSNSPASSAAKQAQASARGNVVPPKTPGAPQPKNPTTPPKVATAPKAPGIKPPAAKGPAAPKAAAPQVAKTALDKARVDEGMTPDEKMAMRDQRNPQPRKSTSMVNHALMSNQPTHELNGVKVKSLKQLRTDKGIIHTIEHMEGEHKGLWGEAHESRLKRLHPPAVTPPNVAKTEKFNVSEEEMYKSNCEHCHRPNFTKGKDSVPTFTPCLCFKVMQKNEEGQTQRAVELIKKADGTYDLKFNPNIDTDTVKQFLLMTKARLLIKRRFGL